MRIKRLLCVLLAALLLAALAGCIGVPKPENVPYEPDTSPPPPMTGVFAAGDSTMTFNGDGSTVVLDLAEDFAARTGLPAGHSEGKYDFIQDLPPYGHVSVRSDTAHSLDITIGEGEDRLFVTLEIGYANEDGSSASVYTGAVTEDCIPILFSEEHFETVLFQRTDVE